MSRNYYEIIDDLHRQILTPALAARAKSAIEELLQMHELDQAEIVRLRRVVEATDLGELVPRVRTLQDCMDFISSLPDCNTCLKKGVCPHTPRPGQACRINCFAYLGEAKDDG